MVYGLLGMALAGALGAAGLKGAGRWVNAGMLVFLVAVFDELNQMSVPGRTGRPLDILADMAGFFLFAVVAGLYSLIAGVKRKGA